MRIIPSLASSNRARGRSVVALACAALALGAAHSAEAAPGVSLGVYGLHGISSGDEYEYQPDPYGLGLGAQAGVTVPGSLYLGASLQQHWSFLQMESLGSDPPIHIERSAWQSRVLGYVGYSWDLDTVTFRPSLGVGYALWVSTTDVSGRDGDSETSTTQHGLVLTPGLEARFPIGGAFSLCGELRYDAVLVEGDDLRALMIGVGVGLDL